MVYISLIICPWWASDIAVGINVFGVFVCHNHRYGGIIKVEGVANYDVIVGRKVHASVDDVDSPGKEWGTILVECVVTYN